MATSKIIYLGNLRTEAIHIKSGTKIITDAPIDNQGKGEAFSPTDLVATALGSCMLTIIGIKARDNNMDIEGTTVTITKIMSAEPRKISEVVVEFNFGDKKFSEKEKIIIMNCAKSCPVALSLDPAIQQSLTFNF
ncbi:MAG: osmotically inducible protein OsmC [Flavobacteriales bacterium CG_4_10_14_0_2_um_filter_32_8]|nr:MAG: osmotically inducible protein OsmC [Flavobacteriales bacterium CG_4_10_14_0_2_um_filter_32_8]PJB14978.1 MAG: osmotically inducible protein OsmC [Flavobacteriales bacterium CG_4_9_14_3_um_filter_32_8]